MAHVAQANGRVAALIGRSLRRIDKAARDTGYLAGVPRFLSEEEAARVPRDEILLICTGSQGEPRAALTRIAQDDHPHIELEPGDTVIFSSRIIPGNEKAIGRLHNELSGLGVDIVTEEDHFVHVSGHPAQDELAHMYQLVRPKVAIPVHGEARHLAAHARLARDCQVSQALEIANGDLVRISAEGARIVDEVPVGRLASDGKSLLPVGGAALQQRRRIGLSGSVVATLVLDREGRLAAAPQVSLIGIVEVAQAAEAAPFLEACIETALASLPPPRRRDDEGVREAARGALRRILNERFGKKPPIEIHLVRL
jgi:ribonuclease J